jgi:FdhD protein
MPLTSKTATQTIFKSGHFSKATRNIATEMPVALSYGGSTQAVMMATPADLEDFAYGFTLNEGIIDKASDIVAVTILETDGGIDLQIELSGDHENALKARRRAMAGPVGCGLCGIESIEQALKPVRTVPQGTLLLSPADIEDATNALGKAQPLFAETHAAHAAGFYLPGHGPGCGLLLAREDVGRHNALDKLCGAMARTGIDARRGAVILTSRVSIEMVQKTAMVGAPVIIAISAPSSLACQMAEEAGITLIALARGADFEIFTHAGRIAGGVPANVA